jgi:hypothetical protein
MDRKDISSSTPEGTPRIFVSYSHDSDEHKGRVLRLAERLRKDGLDCHIDQYEVSPKRGWPQWMHQQIEEATFVLVVCSELYNQLISGKEKPKRGRGRGAIWEGGIIIQKLYEQEGKNSKFIPVVFTQQDTENIPDILSPYTYYDVSSVEGYDRLYRRLRQKPEKISCNLGTLKKEPFRHTSVPSNTPLVESVTSKPPEDNFSFLRESLRNRLINDFFTEGVFKGQFGKNLERRGERHYQPNQTESLKVKPAYYLTYWG